jgi:hypothetical protein
MSSSYVVGLVAAPAVSGARGAGRGVLVPAISRAAEDVALTGTERRGHRAVTCGATEQPPGDHAQHREQRGGDAGAATDRVDERRQ